MTGDCRECKQPLLEIGNRGEHLTGCMACNIWWSQEGKKIVRLCNAFDCSRLPCGGLCRAYSNDGCPDEAPAFEGPGLRSLRSWIGCVWGLGWEPIHLSPERAAMQIVPAA